MRNKIKCADLFCGAGGTSTGAKQATDELGLDLEITAINHWDTAVGTHKLNHPTSRHYCASLDALNPNHLFAEGELDILWASPECTHHSNARGGKPISDQSRATAFCVTRWAAALMPKIILVENVKEFMNWGPLLRVKQKIKVTTYTQSFKKWRRKNPGQNRHQWKATCPTETKEVVKLVWRPDPKRKGETFRAWIQMLESCGYRVEHRVLCAADYGDPTTRRRLFIYAVRRQSRLKIIWPEPTHAPQECNDLLGLRKAWVPARKIIDFSIKGKSIFHRKRPLAEKTIRRIFIGLEKFSGLPFIIPQQSYDDRVRGTDQPLQSVTTQSRGIGLVEPKLDSFILPNEGVFGGNQPQPLSKPLHTVIGKGAGHIVQPELTPYLIQPGHGDRKGSDSNRRAQDIEEPLGAVPGSNRFGLAEPKLEPFIIPQHQGDGGLVDPISDPLRSICTKNGTGIGQPVLIKLRGTNDGADIDQPSPSVTAGGKNIALAQWLINMKGESNAADLGKPAPSQCAGSHQYLAESYLIQTNHGPTEGDEKADGSRVKPLGDTFPTVNGNRGEWAICDPVIVSLDHQGGNGDGARPSSDPLSTVGTKQRHAVLQPYLIEYHGTADAEPITEPVPSLSTKQSYALAQPIIEINGQTYLLDIHFRMLTWRELARAQGLPDSYEFKGTQTEIVKQIGNMVPPGFSRALVRAALTQKG